MNWTLLGIAGVVIIALLLIRRLALASPEQLRRHLRAGARVIDVRTAEEFHRGHVAGALNFPLSELQDRLPQELPDRQQVLLLHCLGGWRSRNGQRQLQRLGYQNVFNLGSLARAQQIVNSTLNH